MPILPGAVKPVSKNNPVPVTPRPLSAASSAGAKIVRLPAASAPATEDDEPLPLDKGACPICRGSGWLRMNAEVGDANFGKLVPCRCKDAEKARKTYDELRKNSNIDNFKDLTFEKFNTRINGVKEPYEAALRFAADPSKWLLFIGNYGCGKTHLAAAIANDALAKQVPLYFAVVPDLLDYLRAAFDPNSDSSYDQRFDMIRNVPLLILDDLGTENAKPWAREKLYQIINHRYNAKLPTVITTNNDLDYIDGRIRSRLMDKALCEITVIQAGDYRELSVEDRARLRQSSVVRHNFNRNQK